MNISTKTHIYFIKIYIFEIIANISTNFNLISFYTKKK